VRLACRAAAPGALRQARHLWQETDLKHPFYR
jgi:hypothetical protein